MKTLLSRAALAAAAMALGLSGAHATQATGNLSVSLTVTSTCSVGASSIVFPKTTGQQDVDGQVPYPSLADPEPPIPLPLVMACITPRAVRCRPVTRVASIEYELYSDSTHTAWNSSSACIRNGQAAQIPSLFTATHRLTAPRLASIPTPSSNGYLLRAAP